MAASLHQVQSSQPAESSSSTSRTGHFTMSPLSQEFRAESPSLIPSESKNDQMTDFLKYIETPSGATQSTGARDIFKAGQRRLRQFAQRPRKNLDPKSKAEETARQLMALQEGGFLPPHVSLSPKIGPKSSQKKSLDSSRSSARSISNLSFKSTSRRDVESIGQPWLTDSLEKKHKPEPQASHLSSLNLQELTSLVEAAVSGPAQPDDVDPPPYRQAEIPESVLRANQSQKESSHEPSNQTKRRMDCIKEGGTAASGPGSGVSVPCPTVNSGKRAKSNRDEFQSTKNQDTDSPRSSTESKASRPGPASTDTQNASAQPPPSLKLFPDTLPSRVSSKGAWRISTGRLQGPSVSLPLSPGQQAMVETGAGCTEMETDAAIKEQQSNVTQNNPNKEAPGEPEGEGVESSKSELPKKTCRRPSSLPMCAIDAFPLPAPMRPLPSLPELSPAVTVHERNVSAQPASTRLMLNGGKRPTLETKDKSAGVSSSMPEPSSLVRTGPTRAERLMSQKRDASTVRLYLNGLEPSQEGNEEEERPSRALTPDIEGSKNGGDMADAPKRVDDQLNSNKRCQRILASEPPSPPPLSPPPMNPARHSTGQTGGRQFRSASKRLNSPLPEDLDSRTRLNTADGVQRSGSVRSSSTQDRLAKEKSLKVGSESPLPSSDDDCTGGSRRSRPTTGRRRRPRPTSLTFREQATSRPRSAKKSLSGHKIPLTPRDYRPHSLEGYSPDSYYSQSTNQSRNSQNTRQSAQIIEALEERITHLERQNKILQAALLAALDVGTKQSLESVLGGLTTPPATATVTLGTGRSFSSETSTSASTTHRKQYLRRSKKPPFRPESWIASPGSSRRGSYETDDVQELEDMIEDLDLEWMSEKSED
ncbi:uncharacterized protein BP01DRAFT_51083 [Aspergillus saccharolyticus JOP 1030-1]|uniref:Uncharacterized protein n=1 Tax=Aspergillus saccharolyticus JOP 1030-1 TaxID=1450539 RepID=A0A318ZLR4_9EURO|nr:hypothetical protein BP01DRAFT_51083 [Aspergillus saccharolyticus JOP 1030-1]PYH45403.1 hypothetical protein BP01DRAFT_51083 [Aspergillus saccharolyticus JOP 1030-1]